MGREHTGSVLPEILVCKRPSTLQELFPNCSVAVEFCPSRTTSPGKKVAPAGSGDPFSSTCFPIMLVANAEATLIDTRPILKSMQVLPGTAHTKFSPAQLICIGV